MKRLACYPVLATLLLCSLASRATSRKVFFIGNSYTYTNSMPDIFKNFASAMGDTLVYAMSAPGGYTLEQHCTNTATISGIFSQPWDIVVVQEQSQKPSFPPSQVATEVYPFATRLDSFIHANDTCTQTMFMMTWGRRNGDAMNCASYPVVCTYEGMQGRLRESYLQMALDNNAIVAPMGSAWHVIIDSFPAIDLYQSDSSHPSMAGSYLQACVFYTSIFNRPASGCTYTAGLPAATAQILQRIADKVVNDSLSNWQHHGHYPHVAHHHAHTFGHTVTFTDGSSGAHAHHWAFGDGHSDTAASPSHTYAAVGTYTVTHTATTDCFSISIADTVQIDGGSTIVPGMEEVPLVSVAVIGPGHVALGLPGNTAYQSLDVFDVTGRLVFHLADPRGSIPVQSVAGNYFYRLTRRQGDAAQFGRFYIP